MENIFNDIREKLFFMCKEFLLSRGSISTALVNNLTKLKECKFF